METSFEEIIRRIIREELEAALPAVARAATPTSPAAPAPAPAKPDSVDRRQHYSVAAAAKILQVSGDYVYDRINDGAFAVLELGSGRSKQRISGQELDRFIAQRSFPRST